MAHAAESARLYVPSTKEAIVGKILEKDQYSYGFDSQTVITTEAMVAEFRRRTPVPAACLRAAAVWAVKAESASGFDRCQAGAF
jgi:exosome complex RNA-binding protein Rrp4